MCKLDTPLPSEYPELLRIWESSVRATHHFLTETDRQALKKLIVEQQLFNQVALTGAHDADGRLLGFMGVSGDSLEMLFIDADKRGKGVGKLLLTHALEQLGVRKLDVNEQNPQAVGFYEHAGFRVVGRSEQDGLGNPFPVLHMEYTQ